ncbi:MAG TPA: adenosylcobinamide-GDP ribazoletransferase [Aliiroseovarius sp.]|nr:adenosylcobinamide-GDP ribazoletransferase [Aliiroseovarius sp.]
MMENDQPLLSRADPWSALALLTRLPVPEGQFDPDRPVAAAAWCWPLVGALIGLVSGLVGLISLWLGLSAGLAAGLTLASSIGLTGALHEDGLADTFDGLWGGQDRARRLEIMHDSRIGTYGVLALVLSVGLRWSALVTLIGAGHLLAAAVTSAALSRVPMALIMARLPNARTSGVSVGAGRPGSRGLWLALGLALGLGAVLVGFCVVKAALWAAAPVLVLAAVARARIGGQTGDILGASQQLAEIAALAALAACVG